MKKIYIFVMFTLSFQLEAGALSLLYIYLFVFTHIQNYTHVKRNKVKLIHTKHWFGLYQNNILTTLAIRRNKA